MKTWTIAKRIIAGGVLLLVLLLIVGGLSVGALKQIETLASSRLRDNAIPGITYAANIGTQSLNAHILALVAGQATDTATRNRYFEQVAENVTVVSTAMKNYEGTISDAADRSNFEELKQRREHYVDTRKAYLALVKNNQPEDARAFVMEKLEPAFFAYRDHTAMILKWNEDASVKATAEIIQAAARAGLTAAVIAGASLLLAFGAGWSIIRGINRALQLMTEALDDASGQVASAAGQVSASSQSLAEGASEQAASLEETSSSLEELSSMTKRNADSAITAKGLSGETRSAAEVGNTDMVQMRQAMEAIKMSSNDISKIIKTIDEIAFQTNILALNAAVEAARAGEAGAGFAVVAEEVRALAQRSANSAKETAAKIEIAIQNGEKGAQISGKVAGSLDAIVTKARQVDDLVAEIAAASQEQNQGIGQINTAVGQMDKVTQSNAGNAEETAAAAEELNAQSATLHNNVTQLRQLVGGTRASLRQSAESATPSGRAFSGKRVNPAARQMALHR